MLALLLLLRGESCASGSIKRSGELKEKHFAGHSARPACKVDHDVYSDRPRTLSTLGFSAG